MTQYVFPSPAETYDRDNEAAFRRMLERALEDIAQTAEDAASTGGGSGADTFEFTASAGSVAITGTDADLTPSVENLVLAAGVGSVPITGTAATLTYQAAAVENLAVTPTDATDHSMDLSWDEFPGATSYQIERAGVVIETAHVPGTSSAPTYTDTGPLDPDTTYAYRVMANYSGGTSAWSDHVFAATHVEVPQGVAGTQKLASCPTTVVTVTWDNDNLDGASRSEATTWEQFDGSWASLGTATAGATTADFPASGTSVTKVRGRYDSESEWSAEATVDLTNCP